MNEIKVKVLVIVPAYNEEDNIRKTIDEIRENASFADILVIDDGSGDGTAKIAEECGVRVISHLFNLRIGGAVQTGFKLAKREKYNVTIQVDADGQHDPVYIPLLMEPIVKGEADIVIGSRYLDSDEEIGNSLTRGVGIRFFSWLATKVTGKKITDCTSGFRALSSRAVKFFSENYPVDFPDAEALILADRAGLKIVERPITFRNRSGGKSSLYLWRLLYYPFKESLSILMLLTKKMRRVNE